MPFVTELPTEAELPRPLLGKDDPIEPMPPELLCGETDFVTDEQCDEIYRQVGLLLRTLRENTAMTAAIFWKTADEICRPLDNAVEFRTESQGMFRDYFLSCNLDQPEYAAREIEHEFHHGHVAAEFAKKHGLTMVIFYGSYRLLRYRTAVVHSPHMGVREIDKVLTTRELIIDYYDTMLNDNPDPSEYDKRIANPEYLTTQPHLEFRPGTRI